MGIVEVDTAGLEALAAQAECSARDLVEVAPPVAVGNSWQPSAVAVDTVSGLVSSANRTLADRLSATAEKLSASSFGYSSQDHRAAFDLRAIAL